jgi:hypothetical protein
MRALDGFFFVAACATRKRPRGNVIKRKCRLQESRAVYPIMSENPDFLAVERKWLESVATVEIILKIHVSLVRFWP